MDLNLPPISTDTHKKERKTWRFSRLWVALGVLFFLVVSSLTGFYIWYQAQLDPVGGSEELVLFEVQSGQSTREIAQNLYNEGLIKNVFAFRAYSYLQPDDTKLQIGAYELSKSDSLPVIFNKIANGESAIRTVTIIPGFTLIKIAERLELAGYDELAVEEALRASYDHPVSQYLPTNASLEGFLYPDTYIAGLLQSPNEIIKLALDEMDQALTPERITGFKAQDLSVFQAVILASIVQRESDDPDLQRQIAQVYLKRYREDIRLDADPTFRYASELAGVEDDLSIDSPYNTRRVKGLPPGPIGAVTTDALDAIISPASGDFLFFVTGDNGKTYFSKTLEEHEANVAKYCDVNCQIKFE